MKLHFPCFGSDVFAMSFVPNKTKIFQNVCFRSLRVDCGCWQPDGNENFILFLNIFSRRRHTFIFVYIENVNVI